MGLFSYYIDNEMTGYEISGPESYYFEEIPGMAAVYLRGGWSLFEPEEGKYDWSLIDMAIQKYGSVGLQVALRITCADDFSYSTPKWVFDAGAKSGLWGTWVMPVWEDPIFLEKLDNFLRALGEKYNGDPKIAYIDVGTLGIFGEGHMMEMSTYSMPLECILAQFEMYENYFPDTLKVANDPIMHNSEWIPIILEKGGFGYRTDVVPGDRANARFFTSDLLERIIKFWKKGPIIFEPDHYNNASLNGDWGDGWDALELVDIAHASFFGLHGMSERIYRENPEVFDAISKRLGYRLIPGEVSLPQEVEAHGNFDMAVDWKNVGAAPCYKGAYPTLTLKNKNGDIVLVLTDRDFNVKDLPVGEPGEVPASVVERATFRAGALLPGGEYDAFLSVGELDGTPTIAMPIDGDDGARRYHVGSIKVQGMYDVTASQSAPSKLTMDFTIRPTMLSTYAITVGRLLYVEAGIRNRNFDFIIDFPNKELGSGFTAKKPFSMEIDLPIPPLYLDKPLSDPAVLKGKRFNVWLEILNNSNGPYITYMTADRGRNSYLGVAELDDNMKWVFTPGDTPE
jgi:hypothetical protein